MKKLMLATTTALIASRMFAADAADAPATVPTALLAFAERGAEVKGVGAKVADLLFAELATSDSLWLVDREDLQKTLAEQELSASGMVNPAEAVKIGGLTGAKILVGGSVFEVDKTIHVVAKIIGTENSRTLGCSVKCEDPAKLATHVATLARDLEKTINEKSALLVAPKAAPEDLAANIFQRIGDAKLPAASVSITEQHIGTATIDPAAETEFTLLYKEAGGMVYVAGDKDATVEVTGEAFSEFAVRRGNFVSVKARVEIKAVDKKTGEVLAIDRETVIEVDLAENIAAKKALQNAAAKIATAVPLAVIDPICAPENPIILKCCPRRGSNAPSET
jgi:curli biogenesis system outer membrane secretion channel CsgG